MGPGALESFLKVAPQWMLDLPEWLEEICFLIYKCFIFKDRYEMFIEGLGNTLTLTALALLLFDGARQKEDARVQAVRGNVTILRKLVQCVMLEPAAKPYEMRLRKIDDDLHFAIGSSYVAEDENIRTMLIQLQTGINAPAEQVEAQLAAIERAVQRRAIMNSPKV